MRARAVFIRADGRELFGPWLLVTREDMAGPHTPQSGGTVAERAGFTGLQGLRERVRRLGQADEITAARAEWCGPIALESIVVDSPKPVTFFDAALLGRRAVSRLMVQARTALSVAGEVGPGLPGAGLTDSQAGAGGATPGGESQAGA